jgi:hypothetical protein
LQRPDLHRREAELEAQQRRGRGHGVVLEVDPGVKHAAQAKVEHIPRSAGPRSVRLPRARARQSLVDRGRLEQTRNY